MFESEFFNSLMAQDFVERYSMQRIHGCEFQHRQFIKFTGLVKDLLQFKQFE